MSIEVHCTNCSTCPFQLTKSHAEKGTCPLLPCPVSHTSPNGQMTQQRHMAERGGVICMLGKSRETMRAMHINTETIQWCNGVSHTRHQQKGQQQQQFPLQSLWGLWFYRPQQLYPNCCCTYTTAVKTAAVAGARLQAIIRTSPIHACNYGAAKTKPAPLAGIDPCLSSPSFFPHDWLG